MLTIIGCGNTNRCDDAAGVEVANRLSHLLRETPIKNVRIFDAGTSGMDTMFQARGSSALIIVDANCSGSTPGTLFEVPGEELANPPNAGFNLHDFRWDHALYAGQKIFREEYPEDVTVYLIEAENLDLGLTISPSVLSGVEKAVAIIWQRICAYSTPEGCSTE